MALCGYAKHPLKSLARIHSYSSFCRKYNNLCREPMQRHSTSTAPSVCIIITTYNPDLDLLKSSITSIANQDYSNLSVIVVDDATPKEKSEAIYSLCAEFREISLRLIRNKTNSGQYTSRNKVIMEVDPYADFYAIQDDDDISHPFRLSAQVQRFKDHPATRICMTNQVRFSDNFLYVHDAPIDPLKFPHSPASSMFDRKVFTEVGYFKPLKTRGDVEFMERSKAICGHESVYTLDASMYLMRAVATSVSASKDIYVRTQLDILRNQMANTSSTKNDLQIPIALL